MSGSADECVSGALQCVKYVIADEGDVRLVDDRLKYVTDHLGVHRS